MYPTDPSTHPLFTDEPILYSYRSIWISDIHLGTYGSKAARLVHFLAHSNTEYLYLVGDIFDDWQLKHRWYWPQSHHDLIQKIYHYACNGTKVVFLSGNHDTHITHNTQVHAQIHPPFSSIDILSEIVHVTADGRRFLVIHGHQFDIISTHVQWLSRLGDQIYTRLLRISYTFNVLRRKVGLTSWSLSAYLKHQVKRMVCFISNYKTSLMTEARRRQVDGVICGHNHYAEIYDMEGILYCNDGDWVESCTALVEHQNGELQIINWTHIPEWKKG